MSTPLKDFRVGITEDIDVWLNAVAVANGIDKAAVARTVLSEWAARKDHEHTVAQRTKLANGLAKESAGDVAADDGTGRRGRR